MRECKLPLRIVLQNFINNVESLESTSSTKDEVYEQEFQELKKLTESLKTHPDFVCTEGEKECNRRKNRYKDILPYDKSRVILQAFPGIPGSDYVNANYIRGASGSRAYIASQGPLLNTVPDFWRMVVECDVQVIIMASNETEGGKHKCECYWVENEGEEKQFGNVAVSFIKSRQVCPDFLVRTLKIKFTTEKDTTEERTICQFHYMLWPDHGVPDTVRPLLHMVRLVRDCQASETLPVLVHCSAGCGRTGTICAIDYVWGLLRTGKLTSNLHLLGLVREMRVQRVAMVQTKEQYFLLHQAVKELFRERLSLIDSHPYENVATDGNPLSVESESKESDYEELLMSRDMQDDITKPLFTSAHTSARGSLSSLLRNPNEQPCRKMLTGKDNLRRSASTSSLDVHKIFPGKDYVSYPPSTSASFDASVQQVESRSSLTLKTDNAPDETDLGRMYSKLMKEVDNIAEKESKEMRIRSSTIYAVLPQNKSKSAASTPTGYPIGNHELALLMNPNSGGLNNAPLFPPKSRTPSPVALRKTVSQSKNGFKEEKRKSTELVRRPSIQKLKEMFEKPRTVIECPNGMRLSRSASSVTSRPNLSLQNDNTMSLKSKKACMGSDQYLAQKSKEDNVQFQICPPPPLGVDDIGGQISAYHGSSHSSSNLNFLGIKRKVSQFVNDPKEEKSTISRSDDRPALPVKKSKSFRWTRSQGNANNISNKSPEFRRKKKTDINSYFSLDRGKENTSVRVVKGEDSIKKIANDFFPPYQDGLKLSVYEASHKKIEPTGLDYYHSSGDKVGIKKQTKPQIPPKKSKNPTLQPLHIPLSDSTIQFTDNHSGSKENQTATPLSAPPSASTSFKNQEFWEKVQSSCFENFYDELTGKSNLDSGNVAPPPKPSRLISSNENSKGNQDYVNTKILSSYLDEEASKVSYVPLPSKREFKDKSNHDYVNCSVFPHLNSKITKKSGDDDPLTFKSKAFQEDSSKRQHSQSSDYEPVDFGETVTSVDEVFETLNYELIESKSDENKKKEKISVPRQDYYLNKDLDSLAIQVYQDCQAYLLHGNNRSPLPSIMPKSPSKDTVQSIGKIPTPSEDLPVTNLEEVKNKVSVPPQGLRNRERRNSYRQAVNTSSQAHSRAAYEKQVNALKKVHKYEKIWFESMKELDEDVLKKMEAEKQNQDFSTNFNTQMNISGKETMFKDKLEELQGLVSNLETKKLPDLSEEELSSRDSGSTSSLLSRSAQSSRSSERVEPIYANAIPGYRSSTSSSEVAGKHSYSLISGVSPYGTLATTTSYPYKQKMVATQQLVGEAEGYPYKMSSNASTLPARSSISPPVHNIPPPQGFGNSFASAPSSKETTTLASENSNPKEKCFFPPIFKELDKDIDPLRDLVKGKRKLKKSLSKLAPEYPELGHLSEDYQNELDDGSLVELPSLQSLFVQSDNLNLGKSRVGSCPIAPPRVSSCPTAPPRVKRNSGFESILSMSDSKIINPQMLLCCQTDRKEEKMASRRQKKNEAISSFLDKAYLLSNPSPPNSSAYYHIPSFNKPFPRPSDDAARVNGSNREKGPCLLPPEVSSTDTEDDSSTQKSSSNLLRKLRGAKGNQLREDESMGDNSSNSEDNKGKRGLVSPPGSPRSFSKAFGKLKMGSKSVAANFRSYLSSTKNNLESNADGNTEPHQPTNYPLQKSVSSGPSVGVFNQVVEDERLPSPIPKTSDREPLQNFRCYDHPGGGTKLNRARQQYL